MPHLNVRTPFGVQVLARDKRTYPVEDYKTSYEKLRSQPNWQQYLKEAVDADLVEMTDVGSSQRFSTDRDVTVP